MNAQEHNRGQNGYRQSLPLDWLQVPEEGDRASLLEFVRGSLCSLSARDDGRFEAVHISRMRRSFEILGAPGLAKVGLRLLKLMQEAEPLFSGYWLPTPFRVVDIEGELVFVGAVPSAHGFLGEVRNEGLSRLLAPDVAGRFPRQSLENWMGLTSPDPLALVDAFVANHALTAAKTSNLQDVEYLSLTSSGARKRTKFHWWDRPNLALGAEKIAICRQSHRGSVRYFSASLRGGHVVSEAPIHFGISRLLFAVACHVSAPITAVIRPGPRGTEVGIDERLPIEEFRLALLLSREIVRAGRSTTFVLHPKLARALAKRLAILGCAVETL